jgi:hypothetical protein
MDGFAYLVGGLSANARRAAPAARKKAPEPDNADAPSVAATPEDAGSPPRRRRRRAKVTQPGRGYEYLDLEPDLGFPGTAAKATGGTAAGLTTAPVAEDGPRLPMLPRTWEPE